MLGRWKNRSVLSPALDDSSMDVLVNLQVYKKHALSPNPYFYLYIIQLFSIIFDINFKYVDNTEHVVEIIGIFLILTCGLEFESSSPENAAILCGSSIILMVIGARIRISLGVV